VPTLGPLESRSASSRRCTSYRVVKAALHKLAAEIELATPARERWCVNTEDFNESGRVYLELADATPAETARGMALLGKLAG